MRCDRRIRRGESRLPPQLFLDALVCAGESLLQLTLLPLQRRPTALVRALNQRDESGTAERGRPRFGRRLRDGAAAGTQLSGVRACAGREGEGLRCSDPRPLEGGRRLLVRTLVEGG